LHAYRMDFTTEPPKAGKEFPTLVPQVDRDGNESSGIRLPELAAPLATYTGWNQRDAKAGRPDMISDMIGSFIPFAKTRAEREKSGDPRPSIEERYKSKQEYLDKVEDAAKALAAQRYLLESDIPRIRNEAAARWDSLVN